MSKYSSKTEIKFPIPPDPSDGNPVYRVKRNVVNDDEFKVPVPPPTFGGVTIPTDSSTTPYVRMPNPYNKMIGGYDENIYQEIDKFNPNPKPKTKPLTDNGGGADLLQSMKDYDDRMRALEAKETEIMNNIGSILPYGVVPSDKVLTEALQYGAVERDNDTGRFFRMYIDAAGNKVRERLPIYETNVQTGQIQATQFADEQNIFGADSGKFDEAKFQTLSRNYNPQGLGKFFNPVSNINESIGGIFGDKSNNPYNSLSPVDGEGTNRFVGGLGTTLAQTIPLGLISGGLGFGAVGAGLLTSLPHILGQGQNYAQGNARGGEAITNSALNAGVNMAGIKVAGNIFGNGFRKIFDGTGKEFGKEAIVGAVGGGTSAYEDQQRRLNFNPNAEFNWKDAGTSAVAGFGTSLIAGAGLNAGRNALRAMTGTGKVNPTTTTPEQSTSQTSDAFGKVLGEEPTNNAVVDAQDRTKEGGVDSDPVLVAVEKLFSNPDDITKQITDAGIKLKTSQAADLTTSPNYQDVAAQIKDAADLLYGREGNPFNDVTTAEQYKSALIQMLNGDIQPTDYNVYKGLVAGEFSTTDPVVKLAANAENTYYLKNALRQLDDTFTTQEFENPQFLSQRALALSVGVPEAKANELGHAFPTEFWGAIAKKVENKNLKQVSAILAEGYKKHAPSAKAPPTDRVLSPEEAVLGRDTFLKKRQIEAEQAAEAVAKVEQDKVDLQQAKVEAELEDRALAEQSKAIAVQAKADLRQTKVDAKVQSKALAEQTKIDLAQAKIETKLADRTLAEQAKAVAVQTKADAIAQSKALAEQAKTDLEIAKANERQVKADAIAQSKALAEQAKTDLEIAKANERQVKADAIAQNKALAEQTKIDLAQAKANERQAKIDAELAITPEQVLTTNITARIKKALQNDGSTVNPEIARRITEQVLNLENSKQISKDVGILKDLIEVSGFKSTKSLLNEIDKIEGNYTSNTLIRALEGKDGSIQSEKSIDKAFSEKIINTAKQEAGTSPNTMVQLLTVAEKARFWDKSSPKNVVKEIDESLESLGESNPTVTELLNSYKKTYETRELVAVVNKAATEITIKEDALVEGVMTENNVDFPIFDAASDRVAPSTIKLAFNTLQEILGNTNDVGFATKMIGDILSLPTNEHSSAYAKIFQGIDKFKVYEKWSAKQGKDFKVKDFEKKKKYASDVFKFLAKEKLDLDGKAVADQIARDLRTKAQQARATIDTPPVEAPVLKPTGQNSQQVKDNIELIKKQAEAKKKSEADAVVIANDKAKFEAVTGGDILIPTIASSLTDEQLLQSGGASAFLIGTGLEAIAGDEKDRNVFEQAAGIGADWFVGLGIVLAAAGVGAFRFYKNKQAMKGLDLSEEDVKVEIRRSKAVQGIEDPVLKEKAVEDIFAERQKANEGNFISNWQSAFNKAWTTNNKGEGSFDEKSFFYKLARKVEEGDEIANEVIKNVLKPVGEDVKKLKSSKNLNVSLQVYDNLSRFAVQLQLLLDAGKITPEKFADGIATLNNPAFIESEAKRINPNITQQILTDLALFKNINKGIALAEAQSKAKQLGLNNWNELDALSQKLEIAMEKRKFVLNQLNKNGAKATDVQTEFNKIYGTPAEAEQNQVLINEAVNIRRNLDLANTKWHWDKWNTERSNKPHGVSIQQVELVAGADPTKVESWKVTSKATTGANFMLYGKNENARKILKADYLKKHNAIDKKNGYYEVDLEDAFGKTTGKRGFVKVTEVDRNYNKSQGQLEAALNPLLGAFNGTSIHLGNGDKINSTVLNNLEEAISKFQRANKKILTENGDEGGLDDIDAQTTAISDMLRELGKGGDKGVSEILLTKLFHKVFDPYVQGGKSTTNAKGTTPWANTPKDAIDAIEKILNGAISSVKAQAINGAVTKLLIDQAVDMGNKGIFNNTKLGDAIRHLLSVAYQSNNGSRLVGTPKTVVGLVSQAINMNASMKLMLNFTSGLGNLAFGAIDNYAHAILLTGNPWEGARVTTNAYSKTLGSTIGKAIGVKPETAINYEALYNSKTPPSTKNIIDYVTEMATNLLESKGADADNPTMIMQGNAARMQNIAMYTMTATEKINRPTSQRVYLLSELKKDNGKLAKEFEAVLKSGDELKFDAMVKDVSIKANIFTKKVHLSYDAYTVDIFGKWAAKYPDFAVARRMMGAMINSTANIANFVATQSFDNPRKLQGAVNLAGLAIVSSMFLGADNSFISPVWDLVNFASNIGEDNSDPNVEKLYDSDFTDKLWIKLEQKFIEGGYTSKQFNDYFKVPVKKGLYTAVTNRSIGGDNWSLQSLVPFFVNTIASTWKKAVNQGEGSAVNTGLSFIGNFFTPTVVNRAVKSFGQLGDGSRKDSKGNSMGITFDGTDALIDMIFGNPSDLNQYNQNKFDNKQDFATEMGKLDYIKRLVGNPYLSTTRTGQNKDASIVNYFQKTPQILNRIPALSMEIEDAYKGYSSQLQKAIDEIDTWTKDTSTMNQINEATRKALGKNIAEASKTLPNETLGKLAGKAVTEIKNFFQAKAVFDVLSKNNMIGEGKIPVSFKYTTTNDLVKQAVDIAKFKVTTSADTPLGNLGKKDDGKTRKLTDQTEEYKKYLHKNRKK